MNIFCHAGGVAANIKMGARLNPVVQLAGAFKQLVLHINFLSLIARERQVEALQIAVLQRALHFGRSEEHTSELQSLLRISYAVFCLKKNNYTVMTRTNDKHS